MHPQTEAVLANAAADLARMADRAAPEVRAALEQMATSLQLEDDARDGDPEALAQLRALEEIADRITPPPDVIEALRAVDSTELVRQRSRALTMRRYGAAEVIENEIDRRHQAAAREQWSTPKVGAKPNRRRR